MRIKNQVILKSMLANHEQWLRYQIAWTCHERGTKKRFWVPMRNGTQTFWFRAPMLYHWATETLHWAKFMFVNRIREMVRFELGIEREKDVFYSTLVTRIKNNHLSYSIYKHNSINIADLSSMRNACHMNFEFVIDLAHHRVSVAQW